MVNTARKLEGQNLQPGKTISQTGSRRAITQLKAMAHSGRLAILFHLYGGAKTVGELSRLLGLRQPAVSQQLARLRAETMVKTQRKGKHVIYSIADEEAFVIVELLKKLYDRANRGDGSKG